MFFAMGAPRAFFQFRGGSIRDVRLILADELNCTMPAVFSGIGRGSTSDKGLLFVVAFAENLITAWLFPRG